MAFNARQWWRATAAVAVVAGLVALASRLAPANRRNAVVTTATGAPRASSTDRDGLARSISLMEAKLRNRPDDQASAVALADALLRMTRVTGNAGLAMRAEQVLDRVLRADGDAVTTRSYDAHRMRAAVYLSQHRFREAIREAERCRQVRPNDAWTAGVLGDAHLELGDYQDAFAAFDRMASLRPDAASYARASYARELQGDLNGALRLMTMAAEATAPQDAESLAWHYAQIGHLYCEMNRLAEARRAYAHADFVFHGHPFAADGLARVDIAEGKREEALGLITARLARAPSAQDAALAGELLESLGRRDEALRQYDLAEAAWRADAPEPAKLARFLAEHHRHPDEAVRIAEQAAADRHDIFTDDALAWAYFQQGRVPEARVAMTRALRTGTRDRDIRRHAAAIEAAADQVARR